MPYKYIVKPLASRKIWHFYRNVALKYPNTFTEEDIARNVKSAVRSIHLIESGLQRRSSTLNRWEGKHMAHAGKWYYAYTIEEKQ